MQKAENVAGGPASALTMPAPTFTVRGRPINPWLVLISLVFGFFMALLDATIVNIAIPTIETNLKTDLTAVTWVLNAYNLIFAVLLVTSGRFADQYGRKRLFMAGMVIFSIGSLFCALAETIASIVGGAPISWLIGFRVLQGLGAAILNPISLAIIMAVFPREKRGAAIGVWGALSGVAAAVGPVLGGFLVQNFDWRWIFFVNLPFCIIGLIMVWLFVPETREPDVSKHIDVPGLVTLTAAIFCVVLAIMEGNSWGWSSLPILGLFAASLVSIVLFVVAELRQDEPIIDFSLFKGLSFTASNIIIFLFGVAVQGAFLIFILYFINAKGYTQLEAAYAALPIPLSSFVISALSGVFSRRLEPRVMAILGLFSLGIGLALLVTLTPASTFWDTSWRSLFIGVGMGLTFQSLPSIVLSEVPRSKLGVGSGVFNTFRQIGFTVGVAIVISVFTGQLATNLIVARDNSIAKVQSDSKLDPRLREGIVSGLKNVQAGGSAGETGTSSQQQVDLRPLADRLPPTVPAQVREETRTELGNLSDWITNEFKTQVVNSFKASWIVAAAFAFLGGLAAIAMLFLHRARPAVSTATADAPPEGALMAGH